MFHDKLVTVINKHRPMETLSSHELELSQVNYEVFNKIRKKSLSRILEIKKYFLVYQTQILLT